MAIKRKKKSGGTFLTLGILAASAAYMFVQYAPGRTPALAANVSAASSPHTHSTSTAAAPSGGATPPPSAAASGLYKNGTYTGQAADAYYGTVQVAAVVQNGKISNVQILQYPTDHSTSRYIASQAMPMLTQEAISAQSANINIISGATEDSLAFKQSLASALAQAKA